MDELSQILLDIADELAVYGELRWAKWLRRDAEWISSGDSYGVTHFLSAFGGMGSLNDLYISTVNGHSIEEHQAVTINMNLEKKLEEGWKLAEQLRRKL